MKKIALVGNPNSGKSTLFNRLTGLFQKTGNYSGITVERTTGTVTLNDGEKVELIDMPGAYSIHPTSFEEKLVTQILCDPRHTEYPDLVLYVLDIQDIDKQMLLLSQVIDLGLRVILILNKSDLKGSSNYLFEADKLRKELKIDVLELSLKEASEIEQLTDLLSRNLRRIESSIPSFVNLETAIPEEIASQLDSTKGLTIYQSYIQYIHPELFLSQPNTARTDSSDQNIRLQVEETMYRFSQLESRKYFSKKTGNLSKTWHSKIDPIATHAIFGPLLFLLLMVGMFQIIYYWASYPMDAIEYIFSLSSEFIAPILGDTWWSSLITDGIIAGLAGVLVFVPQIAMLFFIIATFEDSGYMARIAYLMDSFMKRFGMSGRSMIALISSGACAIPAIMSTRTINSPREKIITILVAPFIGCSARLPIYIIIISFAVPQVMLWGFIDARAFLFVGLYILGGLAALVTGFILQFFFKHKESEDHFIIELPEYKIPNIKTVIQIMWNKTMSFVVEAGKIIFLISIILWFLASYGPKQKDIAIEQAKQEILSQNLTKKEGDYLLSSIALKESYIGRMGHFIEPAIRPLGYDWKLGIGLITSFAAREVFVGTMSTIYSLGGEEGDDLKSKMAQETFEDGSKVYSYATSLSLLIFYVLAMQCMSTLAVVRRETNSWLFPIGQFIGMSLLAYFSAMLVYQVVSSFQ